MTHEELRWRWRVLVAFRRLIDNRNLLWEEINLLETPEAKALLRERILA